MTSHFGAVPAMLRTYLCGEHLSCGQAPSAAGLVRLKDGYDGSY